MIVDFGPLLLLLALVAFVAFTTALLAGKLVYSEPSYGCMGHHYGDYENVGVYKVEEHYGGERYTPLAKRRAFCQHSGCHKSNFTWASIGGPYENKSEAYDCIAGYVEADES